MGDLREVLDRLTPAGAAEREDLWLVRRAAGGPDAWSRHTALHATASALVVHPATGRVLLRWHTRLHGWYQVGGHGDPGETDPAVITLREAREETGLQDLRFLPDDGDPLPVHVVVVNVPAGKGEPAHRHGDLRYVLATDAPDAVRAEHDGADLRWLTIEEALALAEEENLRETLRRAAAVLG